MMASFWGLERWLGVMICCMTRELYQYGVEQCKQRIGSNEYILQNVLLLIYRLSCLDTMLC